MMQIVIILILALARDSWSQSREPPEMIIPLLRDWSRKLINPHIINMTQEIITDAQYKLFQADKVQEKYKHTITYELGTVAAGIQDLYKHMLQIYRTYSDMDMIYVKSYDVYQYLNAYHVVQGDYNQIRQEQKMFDDILEKYEEKKRQFNKDVNKFRDKYKKTTPKFGRRMGPLWKNGQEDNLWEG